MTMSWAHGAIDAQPVGDAPIECILAGSAPSMRRLKETISLVAPSDAPVMVQGDTGVGKELVAEAVHLLSGRSGQLVAVNCAAIPADLLESELFGHEKGAFTGADQRRIGRIEQAAGGTLFLDEIGDMPLALQAKLLRALESRRVQRVGGRGEIEVDFRLVTATHRRMQDEVEAGRFRADLFYRIAVFPVEVPRLADRCDDIPALLDVMAYRMKLRAGADRLPRFSEPALRALKRHSWPGNVRELRNVFERAAVYFAGREVSGRDVEETLLPGLADSAPETPAAAIPVDGTEALARAVEEAGALDLRRYLQDIEADMIEAALVMNEGRVAHAARTLRLQRTTLIEKMKKLQITAQRSAA